MTAIFLFLTVSSFYLATCTRLFQKLEQRIDFVPGKRLSFLWSPQQQSSCIWSPHFTNLQRCLMAQKYLPPLTNARKKSALTNGSTTKRSGTWATEETARNNIYVFPLELAHSIIPELSASRQFRNIGWKSENNLLFRKENCWIQWNCTK